MKTKIFKRLSALLCVMLIFNSISSYALVSVSNDENLNSSLTNEVAEGARVSSPESYLGRFYSDYSDADVYRYIESDALHYLTKRSNCYGYAFRMFYAPEAFPQGESYYGQQIGEFAIKTSPIVVRINEIATCHISDYYTLMEFGEIFFGGQINISTSNRVSAVTTLLQADANALGYTIEEYTGATIPDATAQRNKRLIALVVSQNDYHFYMQHGDNTWSHKCGSDEPSNRCIYNHGYLTNDNIRSHACEGAYSGGVLKFYYISKDTATDYKHRDGTMSSNTTVYTPLINPGDNRFAALDIGDLPEDYMVECIDHQGDVDFFTFCAGDSGTRDICIDSDDAYMLKLCVYGSSGQLLGSVTTSTSDWVTVNLEVDCQYYFSVEALDFHVYEFDVNYTIT